jgi:hypothetical protein
MDHRIRGEVARAELEELGAKHFLDVRATVRRMLESLPAAPRAAFAAAVTERVMRGSHPGEPREARDVDAYAASARPLLDSVWAGLSGTAGADEQVCEAVGRFYMSRYLCTHRHDDPASMADHIAMSALYTAECFLHGGWEFAAWTGWRGFDAAAIRAAADGDWPHRRPAGVTSFAWGLTHPVIQAELERQLEDIELLIGDTEHQLESLDPDLVNRLRT